MRKRQKKKMNQSKQVNKSPVSRNDMIRSLLATALYWYDRYSGTTPENYNDSTDYGVFMISNKGKLLSIMKDASEFVITATDQEIEASFDPNTTNHCDPEDPRIGKLLSLDHHKVLDLYNKLTKDPEWPTMAHQLEDLYEATDQ